MAEASRLARARRLPLLSSDAGPILREADRRSLLGSHLLVVGTNAIAAYMIEAAGTIPQLPDETEDFGLAWSADEPEDGARVWEMLRAVDPTYTINTERDFQARNAKAYEMELLVAPSRAATLDPRDRPRPVPLPEQEWLLLGRPVDHVVPCRNGSPARIVAPDPRWFALHKLWLVRTGQAQPAKAPQGCPAVIRAAGHHSHRHAAVPDGCGVRRRAAGATGADIRPLGRAAAGGWEGGVVETTSPTASEMVGKSVGLT